MLHVTLVLSVFLFVCLFILQSKKKTEIIRKRKQPGPDMKLKKAGSKLRRRMDPMHGVRGKDLLKRWRQYPRSIVYLWARKPYNGFVQRDGRPRKLSNRDVRNIMPSLG